MTEQGTASIQNPTKSFYDRISHVYDALADSGEHAARERGLSLLAAQPGEKILELGYGTGHSALTLAQAVGPTGRVCGVDISEGMQRVARERIEKAGLGDRVELKVAAVPPIPYGDEEFDAVSMSFTLELFPLETIPSVLADIKRVLRPGGRVGIVSMAVTNPGERDSMLERTYKWMHQHFPHIVDCQPIDVAGFVREAGLKITQEERLEIWTMPVVALVATK